MYNDSQDDVTFYSSILWSYYDATVSSNSLNVEFFNINKSDKLGAPKFKMSISGKSYYRDAQTMLSVSDLYCYSYNLKTKIMNRMKDLLNAVKTDQSFSDGFAFNSKRNIYTTFMWSSQLNSACVRFMIGEKERTCLETEKIYVPIVHFFSFVEILNQIHSNYISLCGNSTVVDKLTSIDEKIKGIDGRLERIESKESTVTYLPSSIEEISSPVTTAAALIQAPKDFNPGEVLEVDVSGSIEEEPVVVKEQSEFDGFLKQNRENFDIGVDYTAIDKELTKEQSKELAKETRAISETTSTFISKVCMNDYTILEGILLNCANEKLPVDTFVNLVYSKTGYDLLSGCTFQNKNSLNYIVANNLKFYLGQYLEQQKSLPQSVTPFVVPTTEMNEFKVHVMYDLLVLFLYSTKVRTILSDKNKNPSSNNDVMCYILKTITSAFVFSSFSDIKEDVVVSFVVSKYFDMVKSGFFKTFDSKLKKDFNVDFRLDEQFLKNEVSKIYQAFQKIKDKITLDYLFKSPFMKLEYSDLHDFDITNPTLIKVIELDQFYFRYKNIDTSKLSFKSFDDVPVSILEKYGIKEVKFDNSIIIRFFTERVKGFGDMEQIKRINRNVYDVIDKIDISQYSDDALKALYFWNIDLLPKNINYVAFLKLVDDCSMTRPMLISAISDRNYIVDDSFLNSFLISAE